MWNIERKLKTRKALRAAAAVAAALGASGCAPLAESVSGPSLVAIGSVDGGAIDGGAVRSRGEAIARPADAGSALFAVAPDSSGSSHDAAELTAIDVPTSNDAGQGTVALDPKKRCSLGDGWERYQACCKELGWDFSAGCMAWGPPAPPAMAILA